MDSLGNKVVDRKHIRIIIQFLVIILAPGILSITLFFYLWKKVIIALSKLKYLNKNFLQAVDFSDIFFVSDDFFGKPHSDINTVLILDGIPDLQRIKNDLSAMYNKIGSDGRRMYWKLGCHPVKWCGYWFWVKVPNFDMENQIEILQDTVYTSDDDLPLLIQKLLRKGYSKSCGLWKVTIVPNFKRDPNKCILVFRFNHLIFDGYSWMKFYFRLGGIESLPKDMPIKKTKKVSSLFEQIHFWVKVVPSGLSEYLKLFTSLPDRNCITNFNETKPSGKWICSVGPKIPVNKIKAARVVFDASFFDITIVALMGGLRNYILKHYSEESVPEIIHSTFPIPKINHPDNTLVNHWSMVAVPFPANIQDIPERVKIIKNLTKTVNENTLSTFVDLVLKLTNILPMASYTDLLTSLTGFTMLNSAAPGSPKMPPIFGVPISDAMFWASNNREITQALTFGWFTNNGNVRFTVTADKTFIKRRELLNELMKFIHNEFYKVFKEAACIDGKTENIVKTD